MVSASLYGLLWVTQFLYVAGFIPQIITNYNHRSTEGFSPFTIFIVFFGYLVQVMYVYLLWLPLPFRVMAPVGVVLTGVLVLQRIYYARDPRQFASIISGYASLAAIMTALVLAAHYNPSSIGNIAGWLATAVWATFKIPQAVKVYKEKSVKGFNIWFVLVTGFAGVLELGASLLLGLPAQTVFNSLRVVVITIVFIVQFVHYR